MNCICFIGPHETYEETTRNETMNYSFEDSPLTQQYSLEALKDIVNQISTKHLVDLCLSRPNESLIATFNTLEEGVVRNVSKNIFGAYSVRCEGFLPDGFKEHKSGAFSSAFLLNFPIFFLIKEAEDFPFIISQSGVHSKKCMGYYISFLDDPNNKHAALCGPCCLMRDSDDNAKQILKRIMDRPDIISDHGKHIFLTPSQLLERAKRVQDNLESTKLTNLNVNRSNIVARKVTTNYSLLLRHAPRIE